MTPVVYASDDSIIPCVLVVETDYGCGTQEEQPLY